MNARHASNIITQKYDTALDFHVSMYDNLPYKRDTDYCNAEKLTLHSASYIKYYLCLNQSEYFSIRNKDDEVDKILAAIKLQQKEQIPKNKVEVIATPSEPGITQEQIQTLLDDSGKPVVSDDVDSNDASLDSVNAFADAEDW